MNVKRVSVGLAAALVVGLLSLLLSGKRVLISEDLVRPGEVYVVPGFGNVGEGKAESLVCGYFTGRSVVKKVFWYSPNNVLGKDGCPFILDGE